MTGEKYVVVAYIVALGALALCALQVWIRLRASRRTECSVGNSRGAS
jgi:hypothetical protein